MIDLMLLDLAPDPVGLGLAAVVIILVLGFIALLVVALVVFLWYRKRRMRGSKWPEQQPGAESVQPSNPNQP